MQQTIQDPPIECRENLADDLNIVDLAKILLRSWRQMIGIPIAVGAIVVAGSFLMTPQFTATTSFLPPQNSGSSVSAVLSALGPLAGLASGGSSSKTSGDMYVSLLQSKTIGDRLISEFKLKSLYKAKYQFEAREILKTHTRINFGKKDGIITLEVDDTDPSRAAAIANKYVTALEEMTARMTLTDAQRRRAFFEEQLKKTKEQLTLAQYALQSSGFNQGALKAEPKAAAEEYGRVKAELATTEVQLKALQNRLARSAPEIRQLTTIASALRQQLRTLEQNSETPQGQDYISKYREFKYQEALFDQLATQFEAARLEESKENQSIQVIDRAQIPEWKSKPKRALIGITATLIAAVFLSVFVIVRHLHLTNNSAHRP